jgi:predicted transcriptional regulator
MTPSPATCTAHQSVQEISDIMEAKKIRRMPVLDDENNVIGIVSLGDIAVRVPDSELAGETVEQISKPAEPKP